MFVPAGSAGKVAFAVVTVVRVRSGSAAGPYAITYDFTLDSGLGVLLVLLILRHGDGERDHLLDI